MGREKEMLEGEVMESIEKKRRGKKEMNRLDSPQASQFPCEREGWKHVIPAALINTAQDRHRGDRLLSCCRQQCKAAAS